MLMLLILGFRLGCGQCPFLIMDPESDDFKYYTNQRLVTGPDILFFWWPE
jgi:valyl-tRNA synthetase